MDNLDQNIMDKSMRSVFVGNIPYEATEEKLKDIFSEVGQVLSFKLVFDRETGKPKGYGFCEYRDQETALSAMRNLNGCEIGGRSLRVDNACTEKSRMEMQNLMQQPTIENPYGDPIQADKAPEAISKAVASLPPEQMFELMKQMKLCVQNNPAEARTMLLQNPQLAYALLQAQVVMRIIDPQTACSMLHKANQPPPVLMPAEKATTVTVPINVPAVAPTPVPPPARVVPDFPPAPQPVAMPTPAPVFSDSPENPYGRKRFFQKYFETKPWPLRGRPLDLHHYNRPNFDDSSCQDVDLRAMEQRPLDPRLARMGAGDQDLRAALPAPNPAAAILPSNFPLTDAFARDPRSGLTVFSNDPRQRPLDPRQQKVLTPTPAPLPVAAPRPSVTPQPVPLPRVTAGMSPNIGGAGATDQEKAALIMQVLQLSDEQIAMLPPEQRTSILVLKEQIAKSTQQR